MRIPGLHILEGDEAPLMAGRTTLRLGGRLLGEVSLADPAFAGSLPGIASRLGGGLACLGAGSNILAGDGPLRLVAVRNALPPDIAVIEDAGETAVLRASGSVRLPVLLGRAAAMDLAGLEGLSGIPGTVGGAVAMNAGSFGQCVADTLERVAVVTETGDILDLGRESLVFGYRKMGIPALRGWWMALSADFRLRRAAAGTVRAAGRDILARKKETQPIAAASAGCVFRNPSPENPAGRLLDEAGFKGKRLGGMVFSPMHANFLVNEGQGTAAQALELMRMARDAVFSRYGILLEPEVRVWD